MTQLEAEWLGLEWLGLELVSVLVSLLDGLLGLKLDMTILLQLAILYLVSNRGQRQG